MIYHIANFQYLECFDTVVCTFVWASVMQNILRQQSLKVFLWEPLVSGLTGGKHRQIDPVNKSEACVCMCSQITVFFLHLEV